MKKTFVYAHVSTAAAARLRSETDTQIEALQKFGCDRIFQDVADELIGLPQPLL
jgi:DNA invertase Pin-like site-specific DNA recombinase